MRAFELRKRVKKTTPRERLREALQWDVPYALDGTRCSIGRRRGERGWIRIPRSAPSRPHPRGRKSDRNQGNLSSMQKYISPLPKVVRRLQLPGWCRGRLHERLAETCRRPQKV